MRYIVAMILLMFLEMLAAASLKDLDRNDRQLTAQNVTSPMN